ncbi:MAG: hypothetical protein IT365_28490 [Candidatus Hydrogenedentes bacterium]|nr:hypothetical protein [Candidatus Hydrogenedentota bacterium]
MLDRLIEHVTKLPVDELGEITLQDIAICASWHHSYRDDAAAQRQFEPLLAAVNAWATHVSERAIVTEGRRHQWVLRELIDLVEAGNTRFLAWDELDLLLTALELGRTNSRPAQFTRVIGILEKHAPALEERHSKMSVTPRLPAVSTRLHVVTEDDISSAKPREITLFAGLNIQGRGPVLLHRSGHLRVLGSVPENCTLVVEEGSCSVDGFVMGKVAASQHCEVRENISGVIVVRQGNIRARNIIGHAYVVSKWGRIHCRQSEAPDLVFGGLGILIEQSVLGGRYLSPTIHVKGEAFGGVFMVTHLLTAGLFRCSDARPLSVVLKTELTCQDYGEEPSPDATKLIAQAAGFRRRIAALQTRISYTQGEAEHAARNAIVYLTGKDQLHPVAERLGEAEHRLAQVSRIRTVLQTLARMAEDRLERLVRVHGASLKEISDSLDDATRHLEDLNSDFAQIESEGGFAHDIKQELADIAGLRARLFGPTGDVRKVGATLQLIRDRLAAWDKESVELAANIAKYENELREVFAGREGTGSAADVLPTVNLLKQLLAAVRSRSTSPDDAYARRLQSSFMQLSLRTVGSRMDRLNQLLASLEDLRAQMRTLAETLRKDFQIAVPLDEGAAAAPKVTGRFETGIKIFADSYLLDDPNPPKGAMLETVNSGDATRSYIRAAGKVVPVA